MLCHCTLERGQVLASEQLSVFAHPLVMSDGNKPRIIAVINRLAPGISVANN
jgi:hypothetical protein